MSELFELPYFLYKNLKQISGGNIISPPALKEKCAKFLKLG